MCPPQTHSATTHKHRQYFLYLQSHIHTSTQFVCHVVMVFVHFPTSLQCNFTIIAQHFSASFSSFYISVCLLSIGPPIPTLNTHWEFIHPSLLPSSVSQWLLDVHSGRLSGPINSWWVVVVVVLAQVEWTTQNQVSLALPRHWDRDEVMPKQLMALRSISRRCVGRIRPCL